MNINVFKDAALVDPLKVVSAISSVRLMEREGFCVGASRSMMPNACDTLQSF